MHWYLKVVKNYANFNGRASRTEYWMFTLIDTLIMLPAAIILLGFMAKILAYDIRSYDGYGLQFSSTEHLIIILTSIYALGLFLPRWAVTVRRLHDTNRSGWWLLCSLIPYIGNFILFIFMVLAGNQGTNNFGAAPPEYNINDDYEDGYDDDYLDEYEYDDDYEEKPISHQTQDNAQEERQYEGYRGFSSRQHHGKAPEPSPQQTQSTQSSASASPFKAEPFEHDTFDLRASFQDQTPSKTTKEDDQNGK